MTNPASARNREGDLLIVVTHHIGELDALLPLITLARTRDPKWRASVLVSKRDVHAQILASRGFPFAMEALDVRWAPCLVNAIHEPAQRHLPASFATGRFAATRAGRSIGRLLSWGRTLAAVPHLVAMVRTHLAVTVEGTQHVLLPWLVCRLGRWFGRAVYLHNHSVQPILSLPKDLPFRTDPAHASGIVFSDTDMARSLFGEALRPATFRTGLLKYRPEWTSFCRKHFAPGRERALVIFSKRIQFSAYRGLLERLLDALATQGLRMPVVLKPHPVDAPEIYQDIIEARPSLAISLSSEPNFALVPHAIAALCFPGSSILDCDAFGVPAIEFRLADPNFAPRKTAPSDYVDSGFPSTDDLGVVLDWVARHTDPDNPVRADPVALRSAPGSGNELDALLDRLVGPVNRS